jgi:uncharacterized RDD family membrane protein YckC
MSYFSYSAQQLNPAFLTGGVLSRRCFAWLVDLVLIAVLTWVVWWMLLLFGLATLGFGFGALSIVPLVPFLYNFLSLIGRNAATPGQKVMGLVVRRNADLGPPDALQALIFVVLYYLTLATSGLLLLVALFTDRHRTLHDIFSGLVVVRVDAMQTLTGAQVI